MRQKAIANAQKRARGLTALQKLTEVCMLAVLCVLFPTESFFRSGIAVNFYELLGVPQNAGSAVIRKAIRRKFREFDPDLEENRGDEDIH